MMFKKKDHLVGLDIGVSFIKVAEIKVIGKELVLQKFGCAKIAHGTIVEGRIVDMERLANDIKTLFKSQKILEKNVAISIGGYSVVIKMITISNKFEGDFHDIIYSEAGQYLPYDIDDVNIDYQAMGENESSPDQISVLLVAMKKDIVDEYIDLIHMAGLNPKIIDVDTLAFQNTYEIMSYEGQEKITLLIDVGASKTSFNILKDGSSLMMLDNISGTNQIIEEISVQFDVTIDKAIQVVNGEANNIVSQDEIQEISLKIMQSWCFEIREVVNIYQADADNDKIEKIILSGGGTFVEGFKEHLLSVLDVDVTITNPFEALIVDEKKFSDSFIAKAGPLAPIAVGLALRRVNDK